MLCGELGVVEVIGDVVVGGDVVLFSYDLEGFWIVLVKVRCCLFVVW